MYFLSGTNSTMHQLRNPPGGLTMLVVCPVNTAACSNICRCVQFKFDASNQDRERVDYQHEHVCPTESL